jgi:tetratricopeptide (TPR) repeat protein
VAMEKGRAAMVGQRYQDALDAYQTAVVLMPDDLDATRGVRDAQRRLDDMNKGNGDKVAFQQEMTRGRNALRDRKASIAVAAFQRALAMIPGDPEAASGLQQAKKMQADTKTALTRLLQLGDVAMAAGRYEEAYRRYQDAVTQFPDDPQAQASLQKAQGLLNDFVASQAAYQRFMNQGQVAMRNKLYADAVIAFAEAVRIAPLDADALQGLSDARNAVDKALQAKQDVDRLLTTATQALQQQQWGDAVRALNSALKLNPDDPRIPPLLSKANYGLHMAEGQAAFLAKRWAEAARKYDQALQDNPGDVLARSRRDQARAMAK